jgi:predicted alpha/beta hydrolase
VRFDVPAHVSLGRELANGRPVVLVGHSLIGHAGLIAAGLVPDRAPDALVAFAPNLWSPSLEPSRALRLAKGGLVRAWSTMSRARGYFDARGLGMGSDAEAEPYVTQFEQMWNDDHLGARGGDSYEEALARAELPVLAFSSARDRLLGRPASVARFVGLAPRAAVVHERVVDREAGPAPSHMGFLTDPRSRDLWERAARWILETVG